MRRVNFERVNGAAKEKSPGAMPGLF